MFGMHTGYIISCTKDGNAITDIPSDVVAPAATTITFDDNLRLGDGVDIYFSRDLRTSKHSKRLEAFEGKPWLKYGLGYTVLRNIPLYDGSYCSFGEPHVLYREDKNLEIALRRSNAMERLCLHVGDTFTIYPCMRGHYIEKQNAYSVKQIYDRDRFSSDEQYANFRPLIHCSGIYRSASPFDDIYRRRDFVLACTQRHGIASILDFADTESELMQLLEDDLDYVSDLYRNKRVIAAGNDSGIYSLEFSQSVIEGLRKLIKLPKPWLIHCRAGKRRSGFVCALLEGIAGANFTELVQDYMLSYEYNNGITQADNPLAYHTIARETIIEMLDYIRTKPEPDEIDDMLNVNWHQQCLGFLLTHGMTLDEALELKRLVTSA